MQNVSFLIAGSAFSLGLFATHLCRYLLIIKECKVEKSDSGALEAGLFMTIDLLSSSSYVALIASMLYYNHKYSKSGQTPESSVEENNSVEENSTHGKDNNGEGNKTDKQRCNWTLCKFISLILILVVMFSLAITIPVLGWKRDSDYVENCIESKGVKYGLVIAHSFIKFLFLLTDFILRCAVIIYVRKSVMQWEVPISHEDLEYDPKKNILVSERGYKFYSEYKKIGDCTRKIRVLLKHWFVLQYSVYLLSVLVELVHVIRPAKESNKHTLDIVHSVLVFDFLAFLVPYYSGIWLNNAHHKYHKKMMEKYFKVKIKVGGEFFSCNLEKEGVKRAVQQDYMRYYNVASRNSNILALRKKFDFVPSLFDISIPLDNPGYTFTILLAISSVVFNFTVL